MESYADDLTYQTLFVSLTIKYITNKYEKAFTSGKS